MPSKKEYKRAYYQLRAEVQRLKEARVTDVYRIAREDPRHSGAPSFHHWGEFDYRTPQGTAAGLRNLITRSRDIHAELTDEDGESA